MTDGATVKVEGLTAFERSITDTDRGIDKTLSEAEFASAELVAAEMRRRAPRGKYDDRDTHSGQLARSATAGTYGKVGAFASVGGPLLPYTESIVYGSPSHGIAPNPFPMQSVDASAVPIAGVFELGVNALLARSFVEGEL